MFDKFQIYYQPKENSLEGFKSLTISYYEFDEKHQTYRQKIVLEKDGAKYKIKKYLGAFGAIKPFLQNLALDSYKSSDVNPGDEYFYIKYGDKTIMTSDREDISSILNFARFDEILKYDLSEYKKCD